MRRTAILLVLAAGCNAGQPAEEDCHWIGTLNPLTGDLGTVGFPLENAARLAVRDINAAGLVAGKRLCIATGDTRTNPARAAAVVDALVERNEILALNGAAASASTLQARVAAERYDMAVVSCCSTSPALTDDPLIYRTVPSDDLQGVALAQLAAERAPTHMSIIYLNDTYGTLLRDRFRRAYEQLQSVNTVVTEVSYESAQASYAAEVQDAFSVNPDLVVLIAFPIAGAEIINEWRTSQLAQDAEWLATDGLKDNRFVLLTDDIPNIQGTAPNQRGPYFDGFDSRYRGTFGGEAPGIFTSNQYDAVILIALAMARAGAEISRRKIRDLIPEVSRGPDDEKVDADDLGNALSRAASGVPIDYVGVSGDVDIDDNGDTLSSYQLWSIDAGAASIVEANECFDCVASSTIAVGVTCRRGSC